MGSYPDTHRSKTYFQVGLVGLNSYIVVVFMFAVISVEMEKGFILPSGYLLSEIVVGVKNYHKPKNRKASDEYISALVTAMANGVDPKEVESIVPRPKCVLERICIIGQLADEVITKH